MRHGADWYKRFPQAYLGGVQGLSSKHHAVYSVVLELIYVHGGSINNDPSWVSGWISDMGAASVRRVIEDLVLAGKLQIDGDQITQKRAKNEVKTKEKLSENRSETGRNGGIKSAEIRRQRNLNNDLPEPSASSEPQADKIREEKNTPLSPTGENSQGLFGEEDQPKRTSKRKQTFPEDWTPSDDLREWAKSKGFSASAIDGLAEACVAHHRSKNSLFSDLNAAFRTWALNDLKYSKGRQPAYGNDRQDRSGIQTDGIMRRLAQQYGVKP